MAKKQTKESRPIGRPSVYKPEYCQQLLDYFSEPPYQKIGGQNEASDFPSFAGFAIKIDVHRETLLEWTKIHPEFSGSYKKAKEYQENWLTTNGLKGLLNPAFGIFIMKNVTDYRDEKKVKVEDVTPREKMTDEELEAEIQKRLEQK